MTNSNGAINIAVGAVVAGMVGFLFISVNTKEEQSATSIYNLPALQSRIETAEARVKDNASEVSEINKRLRDSPTTNELDKELEALKARVEVMYDENRDFYDRLVKVELEQARREGKVNNIK